MEYAKSDQNIKTNSRKVSKKQKVRWLKEYKRIVRKNKDFLKKEHNLKKDWIDRLWKVYTVPIEERQNIIQYGNKYLDELIRKELAHIDRTFMKIGLVELSGITVADVIDDFNVRLVISYKYIDLVKRANRKLTILGGFLLSLVAVSFIIFL